MATYTTNLNLKKPAQSDKIRIADINNNMDDIDAAFGAIGNDSVATQIGNIQGALAIVAVGDSHAAVTAGQFVYVRSHETLDAGLYVASANIAENGALSLSNLTADPSGGLNALNSNMSTWEAVTVGVQANIQTGSANCYKNKGTGMVDFNAFVTANANVSAYTNLFTGLPAPKIANHNVIIADVTAGTTFRGFLSSSNIGSHVALTSGHDYAIALSYVAS